MMITNLSKVEQTLRETKYGAPGRSKGHSVWYMQNIGSQ